MHKLSIITLVVASLAFSTAAYAQVAVNAGANTTAGANVNAGGVSVNAGATTSTSAAAGADTGAGNGNGGSSAAAAGDGTSSAANASASASGENATCGTVSAGNIGTGPMDSAVLAGVTTITVFSTSDCSGLAGLNTLDAGTGAELAANASVAKAITDAGYTGQQIAGYTVDGTSLTVYVKK